MSLINRIKNKYFYAKPKKSLESGFDGNMIGENNIIQNFGTILNSKLDIIGNRNVIIISERATFCNTLIFIRGDNHKIFIGEDCRINGGSFWMEDNSSNIHIGDKTTIGDAHLAVTESGRKIIIGKDCMLSKSIEIRTGDSHSIIDIETNNRINPAKNVIVGDHVWIGAHAKILKGVNIGNNSIVGLNAIVTQDVPNNVICSGMPARVIREGVTWIRERIQ